MALAAAAARGGVQWELQKKKEERFRDCTANR
jgi:hypothetical protein